MRISDAALPLLCLAGCSSGAASGGSGGGEAIDCALAGAPAFAHDCTVERSEERGVRMLVVHHPDGGFRRLKLLDGGAGLAAADGAEAVTIARNADGVDASIDGDRYRFPASMLNDESR